MSYIPDARAILTRTPYTPKEVESEENYYWEGYLSEEDSRELVGFDEAVEAVENMLVNNADHLCEYAEILGLDSDKLSWELSESELLNNEQSVLDMDEEELEKYSKEEKFLKCIHEAISSWLEMERDEINCSMHENYSDEESEELRTKTKKGYKNAVLRRYKD